MSPTAIAERPPSINADSNPVTRAPPAVDTRLMHYGTIEMPPAAITSGAPARPALMGANVSVPPELQEGRICYRVGSNEVRAYQFHRWIERPGAMIPSRWCKRRESGKFRSVMENSSAAGGYQLRGKLYEFDEIDARPFRPASRSEWVWWM